MPRPIRATIHLDAMQHNLERARACVPGAKAWAVVKANAYGHGLERATRAFASADGLALIEPDYAVHLRALGWTKPILLLEGVFDPADARLLASHGLNSAVHCDEQLRLLELAQLDRPVDVHLKLNTGMNRLGFSPARFAAAYARLRAIPAVRKITLMTHFANADVPAHPRLAIGEQIRRFRAAAEGLDGDWSLSNSAAVLQQAAVGASLRSDWIRPGIMLYGGSPGHESAASHGLLPAMSLESELIAVQQVEAGEYIGYGSRFQVERPMRVGVVACGYADGYPRHAGTDTPILVDGVRTRTVGRVSMDMLAVDLGPVPQAQVGSRVTLWGKGLPIDEVAHAAGTIGYELMCALAARVRVEEAPHG
ncbi:alanine racemase [Massilia sp. TS11]|uniref:alanine racemase n=1 Tax=Massilia sp. TS11 TaxID=2908003 RepID=UPI001EDC7F86|nr:alanine racemase [Massilia sp. TS11]MCG2584251.1 alanine racemase [Massilia sp. TS11]